MRWLSFRIFNKSAEDLGMRFAIRESQAVESIPFSGVIPTPASPEAVLGTLNYRGKPIRVFDLGSALGLGPGQLPQRVRLLIARRSRISPPIAIAVQPELEEVTRVDEAGLQVLDLRILSRIGRSSRGQDPR